MRIALILAGVAVLLSGCSAQRDARALARETLIQVVEYEEALRQARRAADEYYKSTHEQFGARLVQQHVIHSEARLNLLAEEAVQVAVSDGYYSGDVRAFVETWIDMERASRLQTSARLAELKKQVHDSTEPLVIKTARFKSLRAKLEQLQSEQKLKDQLKDLRTFLKEAEKAYRDSVEDSQ